MSHDHNHLPGEIRHEKPLWWALALTSSYLVVEVIGAFSSDGRIAAYDLTVLEDPRNAFPPYDAVLLVSPAARTRPGLIEALEPLLGRIDDQTMRQANKQVDLDGQYPERVGRRLAESLPP